MISSLITACWTAICFAVILALTIAILGVIVYLIAGVISSLIETFKEVRAKQKADKFLKSMNALAKSIMADCEESSKQKTDSH